MATDEPDDSPLSIAKKLESVDESRKKDAVIRRADEDLVSWLNRLSGQTWIDVNVGELSEAAGNALMDCMHLGAIEARFAAEAFLDPMGERWQIEVRATGNRWRQRLPIEVEKKWADGAKVQPDSTYRLRLTEYGDELHSDIQSRPGELGMILLHARLYHLIDPDVRITDKGTKQPAGHNGASAVAVSQSSASIGDVVVHVHVDPAASDATRQAPGAPLTTTAPKTAEPDQRKRPQKKNV